METFIGIVASFLVAGFILFIAHLQFKIYKWNKISKDMHNINDFNIPDSKKREYIREYIQQQTRVTLLETLKSTSADLREEKEKLNRIRLCLVYVFTCDWFIENEAELKDQWLRNHKSFYANLRVTKDNSMQAFA